MVIICKVCQRIVPKVDSARLCDDCGGYDKSSVLPNYYCLYEMDEKCPKCTYPMHTGHGQDQYFCPNCAVENMWVERGRAGLAKLKAKLAETQAVRVDPGDVPWWPGPPGTPL